MLPLIKLTIRSVSAGAFPSLNCMIFWVVGRNCEQPVHGLLAFESWPIVDEPDIWVFCINFSIANYVSQKQTKKKGCVIRIGCVGEVAREEEKRKQKMENIFGNNNNSFHITIHEDKLFDSPSFSIKYSWFPWRKWFLVIRSIRPTKSVVEIPAVRGTSLLRNCDIENSLHFNKKHYQSTYIFWQL